MAVSESTQNETPPAQEGKDGLFATVVDWGPLWFGLAFLAPLVAQSLDALALEAPLFPSNLAFGLTVGGVGGFIAKLRGSWL